MKIKANIEKGNKMHPIVSAMKALLDGVLSLVSNNSKEEEEMLPDLVTPDEIRPNPAANFTTYSWHCWLCSGESQFACQTPQKKISYILPCSRCGIENRVEVRPVVQERN